MIIGISGKKGAGKDVMAEIIKEMMWSKKVVFQHKRFAHKIKEITSILLGCDIKQLEDREFKEKELGEEWWYYEDKNGKKYSYLDYDGDVRKKDLIMLTPRLLMQLLGTECGREIIHPNIWINATFADYVKDTGYHYNIEHLHDNKFKIISTPKFYDKGFPNWIISDVRFPNEVKAIKDREGILIRLNRLQVGDKVMYENSIWNVVKIVSYENLIISNGYTEQEVFASEVELYRENEHESETALDDYKDWDYVINNNTTFEELEEAVMEILINEDL